MPVKKKTDEDIHPMFKNYMDHDHSDIEIEKLDQKKKIVNDIKL